MNISTRVVINWIGSWAAFLLIVFFLSIMSGCASTPQANTQISGMMENESMPLDPLLQCAANALRIYEVPPRVAIQLSCSNEIQALEEWAIELVARTGLTLEEVEYIIAEESAGP